MVTHVVTYEVCGNESAIIQRYKGGTNMIDVYTIEEAARILKISERATRELVNSGAMRASLVAGAYRLTDEQILDFLKSAEITPEQQAARHKLQRELADKSIAARRELRIIGLAKQIAEAQLSLIDDEQQPDPISTALEQAEADTAATAEADTSKAATSEAEETPKPKAKRRTAAKSKSQSKAQPPSPIDD